MCLCNKSLQQNAFMSVKLRERKSGSKILFYLDIYHDTKRRTEYLTGLYLFPKPEKGRLTKEETDHNKHHKSVAEEIRYQREKELLSGTYNIHDASKINGSFIEYFTKLMETKRESDGNYGNWYSTKGHLEKYLNGRDLKFSQINKEWLLGFKEYLEKDARTKSKRKLLPNTLTLAAQRLSLSI